MASRSILAVALLAALGACSSEPAEEPAADASTPAEPATTEGAAAPSPEASEASAATPVTEPPFAVKEGERVKVTKQAECFEVADPAASPWTMFEGVTPTYKGMQDGKAKVVGASGVECLIAWDALGPA